MQTTRATLPNHRPGTALRRAALLLLGLAAGAGAAAQGCVVQGGWAVGDCGPLQVQRPQPRTIFDSGSYSGNYARVVIRHGATVTLSGNSERIVVQPGARLYLSGNTGDVEVWGLADLTGNIGRVFVHPSGMAIIRGTAQAVGGPGQVIAAQGSVVGGVPVQ